MSTNRDTKGSTSESDEFDWRWVGEPESWIGLRSERAKELRPTSVNTAGTPPTGRFTTRLVRSLLSLLRG